MSTDDRNPAPGKQEAEAVEGVSAPAAPNDDWPALLRLSDKLRGFVDAVGRWASWLILPLVLITCLDIVTRKMRWVLNDNQVISVQLWLVENLGRFFESTILQELEWHFHTGLFALVLGYGYIWNAHVRVDLIRERLAFRKKAWLELLGLSLFLIPYTMVVIWFATEYTIDSYNMGEISASTVGLTHRWIIKGVLTFGLVVALIAGIAVLLQVIVVLWGPSSLRFPLMTIEWPEEDARVEGKTRLELSEPEDDSVADTPSTDRQAEAAVRPKDRARAEENVE